MNMKRIILILIFLSNLFFDIQKVSAQNHFYLGGQAGIQSLRKTSDASISSFSISPDFGYQLKDRWVIGFRLSYSNIGGNSADVSIFSGQNTSFSYTGDQRVNSVGIAPYARFKCFSKEKFGFWLEENISYDYIFVGHSELLSQTVDLNSIGINILPVITWNPLEHFTFYTSLDFMALGYNYVDASIAYISETVTTFNFSLDLKKILNLSDISIGVYYSF